MLDHRTEAVERSGARSGSAEETAWRAAVARVLKGGTADRLVTLTDDGIPVAALYPAADVPGPAGARPSCAILSRLDRPEAEAAETPRGDALDEVENGADGLVLAFAGAASARGFGLATQGHALARALDGIALDRLPLTLEPPPFAGAEAASAVLDLAASERLPASSLDLEAGLDPIADMARSGPGARPWPELAAQTMDAVRALRDRGLAGPLCRADGRLHHEAGATEAQELAGVLAAGVAYLRLIEAARLPLATAEGVVSFLLVADQDIVLTMAKLRALRRLWARVEDACGLAPQPIRLHVETSWRMMTRRDPPSNLLRAGLAAFGAVLGGADRLTVLPFTAPLGLSDSKARRLARNTALVLLAEAGLDRVADPAAGSGVVEGLTEALSTEAWAVFQSIEAKGGLPAAVSGGDWPRAIAVVRERRRSDFRENRRTIVGTTHYRLDEDGPVGVPRASAIAGVLPSLRDDELLDIEDRTP